MDSLEKYRGKCKPCFLFFAGGVLVAVVRGANSPVILRTITQELQQEHSVLEGNAERKEVRSVSVVAFTFLKLMSRRFVVEETVAHCCVQQRSSIARETLCM